MADNSLQIANLSEMVSFNSQLLHDTLSRMAHRIEQLEDRVLALEEADNESPS
jgi:hypothetical protein